MSPVSSRSARLLAPLFVVVAGAGLFAGTLGNPFTSDDVLVTLENAQIQDPANIPGFFLSDFDWRIPQDLDRPHHRPSRVGLYRPLLITSYAIDHLVSGLDPFGWRLTNLVLHLAVCLVLLGLARRLLGSLVGATAAALLFAAHPVHTEAVATLVGGRAEMLATLFVLAAWWVFLKAETASGARTVFWLAGSAFLFLLGLLSKENAAVLPGILFLCGWTLRGQATRGLFLRLLPHLVVLGLYLVFRLAILGGVTAVDWSAAFGGAGAGRIVLSVMAILAAYPSLFLAPYPLQLQNCYENLARSVHPFLGLVAGVLLLALLAGAAARAVAGRSGGRPSHPAFAVLLFYLCLFPVSHVVPFFVVMAERFLYLPSVALCLLAGWLVMRAASRNRWIPIAAGLPLLAGCALGTLVRNADWADPDRLWTKTSACAPDSPMPHNNMGTARLRRGRPGAAIPYFRKAMELDPGNPRPVYNLGVALQRLGKKDEAEKAYRRALELAPDHTMALLNLGSLLEGRGDREGAMLLYRRAADGDPSHPAPFVNIGNLLQRQGRFDEAEKLFRLAIRIAPARAEARFNLARLLGRTGRTAEAERLYLGILTSRPDHVMAHNNLANLLKDRGELAAAESHYLVSLRLDPGCVPAHYNLANLYMATGKAESARHHYTEALRRRPDHLEARIGLGYAWLKLANRREAHKTAREAEALAPEDPRVQTLVKLAEEAR